MTLCRFAPVGGACRADRHQGGLCVEACQFGLELVLVAAEGDGDGQDGQQRVHAEIDRGAACQRLLGLQRLQRGIQVREPPFESRLEFGGNVLLQQLRTQRLRGVPQFRQRAASGKHAALRVCPALELLHEFRVVAAHHGRSGVDHAPHGLEELPQALPRPGGAGRAPASSGAISASRAPGRRRGRGLGWRGRHWQGVRGGVAPPSVRPGRWAGEESPPATGRARIHAADWPGTRLRPAGMQAAARLQWKRRNC
ncbi:hypothetical protein GO497_12440 [Acidovorax citrulli]|nr:hypothetical protein [Paracidovorax citrulli]